MAQPPPHPLSDISHARYTCLMWFFWCSQDIHELLMYFLVSLIWFAWDLYECFNLFFFREGPVLSSCQLNGYIFLIAGNSSWFSGILRRARRANPSFENILSLENDSEKHVMFRLFYLNGYCFLRRALEPCTSIVTHATQCSTDLCDTDSL